MENKTRYRFSVHYYSIVTVGTEYVAGKQEEQGFIDDGSSKFLTTEINRLSPYIFLLYETENGRPYWQYFDLAGNLDKLSYTDEKSYVEAIKIVNPDGTYMYRAEKVYIQRK